MQLIKTQTEGFGQTGNRQERRRGHTAAFQAPDRVDGHRRLARKIRCRSSPLPALGRDEKAQLSAMLPVSGRCRPTRHDDKNTCILIRPHNRRLALSTAECSGPAGCTMASSSRESGSRPPVSWSVTEVPIRKRLHSVSASPTARLRCADDAALTDSRAASRHAALLVRAGIGVVIAASGLDCWLTRGNQAAHVQGPASMVVLLPWSSCSRRATNRTVGRTAGMQGC